MYYIGNIQCIPSDIQHFGILGMKWGVRRYQNRDGTLTPEGKKRYNNETASALLNDLANNKRNLADERNKLRERFHDIRESDSTYNKLKKQEQEEYSKLSELRKNKANKKEIKQQEEKFRNASDKMYDFSDYLENKEIDKYIRSLEKGMSKTTIDRIAKMDNYDEARKMIMDVAYEAARIQIIRRDKGEIRARILQREIEEDFSKNKKWYGGMN